MQGVVISCVLMCVILCSCSKTTELDAPCPDYGRYCRQTPINAWDNEKSVQ